MILLKTIGPLCLAWAAYSLIIWAIRIVTHRIQPRIGDRSHRPRSDPRIVQNLTPTLSAWVKRHDRKWSLRLHDVGHANFSFGTFGVASTALGEPKIARSLRIML